jgi:exodeoxyribonuclease V alpha subunit
MECIEGVVERITYKSDDGSGFVVAKIKEPQKKDVTAIVGNLGPINIGENLRLYGFWEDNKKYKVIQFRVSSYETLTPATLHGIEKYLGSGIIKGLGEKTAQRIVKKFGLDTFHVIENNPDKLKSVEKVGKAMVEKIKKGWEQNKQLKDVMVFLQGQDISPAYASRIYKKYKEKTVAYVKENPYRLADDIHGIGFKKADHIAKNFGIDQHSPIRVEAFIKYRLEQLAGQGHVYYPYDMLIEECTDDLDIDRIKVEEAIQRLSSHEVDQLVVDDIIMSSGKTVSGKIISAKAVYLKSLYTSESRSSQRLNNLLKMKPSFLKTDIDKAIVDFQTETLIMLSDLQKEAVKRAVYNKVMVITGGPGTGKTTIIRCICSIFSQQGFRVGLAAPTGRASKRMEEATGMPAKTIHRLLEYSPQSFTYTRHQNRPLDAEIVIVDEFSMVDINLYRHLLEAIPLNGRLIMVGDVDQLPSVGPGNVLRDIIGSSKVPVVKLTEIHRQKKDSHIIVNAHRINHGQKLILPVKKDKDRLWDFYLIEQEDKPEIISTIVKLCKERIPDRFGYDPIEDIQVLSPMQVRDLGVVNLNRTLQENLNDNPLKLTRGKTTFKVGDKVMQTRNNYDKDVFNGDIGRIKIINTEDKSITVQFDENKYVNYEGNELDEIVLAYAISIHKSQGSEYKAVIIPIHTQHYIMLKRNLLYTAVTRGKELVILIGMSKAIYIAVRNSTIQSRYTMLAERLIRLDNYEDPADREELF